MKREMKKVKAICELEISFIPYDSKELNDDAVKFLKKWIKEILANELSHIPLNVEKDDDGYWMEDCTHKVTHKVRVEE